MMVVLLVSCGVKTSEGASVADRAVIAGVEFSFRGAEVVPLYGPREPAPGVVEEAPVFQFIDSEARLRASFYRSRFDLDQPPTLDSVSFVTGCIDGGEVAVMAYSKIEGFSMPRVQREFLNEAGLISQVSVALNVRSLSGLADSEPQLMSVRLTWRPEPFERGNFDYSAVSGSEYAATVPTIDQLRTLVTDLYRSLTAAAAGGSGCTAGTELTEEKFLAGFDEQLAAIVGTQTQLPVIVGVPVEVSPIPVEANGGFVLVDEGEEWARMTETVRVVADRSLAGMSADAVAVLEGRLMAITEEGRELVTDDDWSEGESMVYTPNYASVAVDGGDLVITIDTKGVMTPAMRDAMIAVIGQAAVDAGATTIEITDIT